MASPLWMKERVELMKAMKSSPIHLQPSECDYVPPLELIGIYITHATVTRMVARGELDSAVGTYMNAALGVHSFCVLHHCTHESVSQHNDEHKAFENTTFRLGSLLLGFDDGYKEAHRQHHARTEKHDDPDQLLSHTQLETFGKLIFLIAGGAEGDESYQHMGIPITYREADFMCKYGLLPAMKWEWLGRLVGAVNWDNMVMKMTVQEAINTLKTHSEYKDILHTLSATWFSSNMLSYMLCGLFFARYTHRNGVDCENEIHSFYDNTYRAEDQCDLWMMGEGAHHLHHAKPDVSYARLPAMCADIEERHPELKLKARGNKDIRKLEYTHDLPAKLKAEAGPQGPEPAERTNRILAAKETLLMSTVQGIDEISSVVADNAIRCCTTADRELLRELFQGMKLQGQKQSKDHAMPVSKWCETVLSERTSDIMLETADRIKAEVSRVAREVGEKLPQLKCDDDIKEHYFDVFMAMIDTLVTAEQQETFLKQYSSLLGRTSDSIDKHELQVRMRSFLESAVPEDFVVKTKKNFFAINRKTSKERTRERVGDLICGPRSRL